MKAWDNRPKYQACDNIPSHTALTEKQLLLCVSMIGASDPESNKKIMISVQNLRPIIWNKTVFDQLVLAREKKDRLIRVLRDHLSEHSSASSDIIEGKGQVSQHNNSLKLISQMPKGSCNCAIWATWCW
jgi:hypothetical protein